MHNGAISAASTVLRKWDGAYGCMPDRPSSGMHSILAAIRNQIDIL